MSHLLDDERISGALPVDIRFRPDRHARTVDANIMAEFRSQITYLCQVWSGANVPILPLHDRKIPELYVEALVGGHIDGVRGLPYQGLRHKPLPKADPQLASWTEHTTQFVFSLLKYQQQDEYLHLVSPTLAADDPWYDIYAANLGNLSAEPSAAILRDTSHFPDITFDDFVRIDRSPAVGSLTDLLQRLSNKSVITPRQLSMHNLSSGLAGNSSVRRAPHALPDKRFAHKDSAGNIVVACSPGNVEDVALLWNLRTAFGDRHVMPIGFPAAELNAKTVWQALHEPWVSRDGSAAHQAYVTSTSISVADLREAVAGAGDPIAVVKPGDLISFGPAAGWPRREMLFWDDGRTTVVPQDVRKCDELSAAGGVNPLIRMKVDVGVPASPYPNGPDSRTHPTNGELYAGVFSQDASFFRRDPIAVEWPTRLLGAKILAFNRGLDISASEPGRAASVACAQFKGLWEIGYLAHAPLLALLEQMASRTGMAWARKRLRAVSPAGAEVPEFAVAPSVDDLPETQFDLFKKALGGKEPAAIAWLEWAETRGLLVKGFGLVCSKCRARQWIPVAAFEPPIVCRGCGDVTDRPFGASRQVNFTYRLSERLRRVYEHDAIGHLLLIRFFDSIFGDRRLIGLHTGLDFRHKRQTIIIGEADVALLFRSGELVLAEVKRSLSGLVQTEVDKLETLSDLVGASWSAVAGCQYLLDAAGFDAAALEARDLDRQPFRIVLSYDRLLEKHPVWSMGGDPFHITPLSRDEIADREAQFVGSLMATAPDRSGSFMEFDVLREPYQPKLAGAEQSETSALAHAEFH